MNEVESEPEDRMSVDEHEAQTCIRCGSPMVPCACDCDHDIFVDGECEDCGKECEHWDTDGRECLVCGADLMEDLMCRAHEIAEGDR